MRAFECRMQDHAAAIAKHTLAQSVVLKEGSLLWSVITETAGRHRQKKRRESVKEMRVHGHMIVFAGKTKRNMSITAATFMQSVTACRLSSFPLMSHVNGFGHSLSQVPDCECFLAFLPRNLFHINSYNRPAVPAVDPPILGLTKLLFHTHMSCCCRLWHAFSISREATSVSCPLPVPQGLEARTSSPSVYDAIK